MDIVCRTRGGVWPAVLLVLLASEVKAGDAKKLADLQARLSELQAVVQAQQQQIEQLTARLEQAEQRDLDAARVEQIRQVLEELMADSEYRRKLLQQPTTVGYDQGFYIKHTTENESFLLKIRGRIQLRYTGISRQSDDKNALGRQWQDDRSGFEIPRTYLTFSGHIWTEDLTYNLTLYGNTDTAHDEGLYYGWVNYRFCEAFQVRMGVYKLPFGRQETESDGRLQFVDRALPNEVFNLDRGLGVWLHGNILNKALTWNVSISNGFANANDDLRDVDTNFAYVARLVWHALKGYGKGEADLAYYEEPALDLGLSFAYNDDNGDEHGPSLFYAVPDMIRAGRGGIGLADASGTDYYMFGADASFKWRGLSAHAEYWVRTIDSDDWRSDWQRLSGHENATHQQGGYLQLGYMIPGFNNKLEVVGRLGGVWDNDGDNCWEYGGGVNYYIKGHSLKLQADVTRVSEVPINAASPNYELNDEITMVRVQLQAAF